MTVCYGTMFLLPSCWNVVIICCAFIGAARMPYTGCKCCANMLLLLFLPEPTTVLFMSVVEPL